MSRSGLDHCPAGSQSLECIPYAKPSFVANLMPVADVQSMGVATKTFDSPNLDFEEPDILR